MLITTNLYVFNETINDIIQIQIQILSVLIRKEIKLYVETASAKQSMG